MRIFVCKKHCRYLALLAGWAAAPVLLIGQPTSGIVHQAQYVCMWNEAVCQAGSIVSIGVVATDSDMSALDGLRDVRELGFIVGPNRRGAAKISDAGFIHIQSLHGLQVLHAMQLPLLTDDALWGLSELTHLREARFESDRNFSDAGLAHLRNLKELQTLTFYGAPITDRGILYLRESANLQDLQLGESRVTDEGAREIVAQFRNLKMLDLQGTEITDKGVAALAALPHLEWLCLTNTSVTDSGILALRSVSTLRDLYLTSSTVHSESITSLQHALPGLRIHRIYRNGSEMPDELQGRKPVKFEIPTKLGVTRSHDKVTISARPDSTESVWLSIDPAMSTGMRTEVRVYASNAPRPAQPDGIELKSGTDFASIGEEMLNREDHDFPTPGKEFVIEMDLSIFETEVPPQHMWNPMMGSNYKTIWHGVITQTIQ